MVDGVELLNDLDQFSGLRNGLRSAAHGKGEWAGIPMPLEGEELVIDPSYPFADALNKKDEEKESGIKVRNTFWSHKYRSTICIYEEEGKIKYGLINGFHGLVHQMRTLGCSAAWGIEQEASALQTLGTLLRHHAFKQYLLTGSFLETSKKSGVTYMFRKLRPTVALSGRTGEMKILCCLCMHPIAYYQDSWAGAMTPTDDVIAHLMMMRADEHMLWKRCNQHPAYRPEAGL